MPIFHKLILFFRILMKKKSVTSFGKKMFIGSVKNISFQSKPYCVILL